MLVLTTLRAARRAYCTGMSYPQTPDKHSVGDSGNPAPARAMQDEKCLICTGEAKQDISLRVCPCLSLGFRTCGYSRAIIF
jgi:hypothetical protein